MAASEDARFIQKRKACSMGARGGSQKELNSYQLSINTQNVDYLQRYLL